MPTAENVHLAGQTQPRSLCPHMRLFCGLSTSAVSSVKCSLDKWRWAQAMQAILQAPQPNKCIFPSQAQHPERGLKPKTISWQCYHCDAWHPTSSLPIKHTQPKKDGFGNLLIPSPCADRAHCSTATASIPDVHIYMHDLRTTLKERVLQYHLAKRLRMCVTCTCPRVTKNIRMACMDGTVYMYVHRHRSSARLRYSCVVLYGHTAPPENIPHSPPIP